MIEARLAKLEHAILKSGAHAPPTKENGPPDACAMELVAWLAGEPWSDRPACACPVITSFVMSWNDTLPDSDRTRVLRPFLPRIVGSKSTPEVEMRRSYMALDWLVRTHAPAWLDLNESLKPHAAALRALDEIVDSETAWKADPVLQAARSASAAAGDAARDAARTAAGDAAWAAAWAFTRDAARTAAGDAAWAAARDAAWAATRDAARDAARDALASTKLALQDSAAELLDRMLRAGS